MIRMSLLIFCALATLAFAAHPLVQELREYPCVDGVNNVVTLEDIDTAGTKVHVDGVVAQLYDANNNPSCKKGKPMVAMPGLIRLVKGKIIVKEGTDIKRSAVARWTIKFKKLIKTYTVCKDGVKDTILPIPNVDKVCKQDISDIGDFAKVLATPGEYDLEEILKTAGVNAKIKIPEVSGVISGAVKGNWQAALKFESEGKTIAHIKAPSNDWLYVE
ncbi:unnamed protein product [Cylicocyclus nassatus]|uniref:Uncharacterized protein n=1 Tax=Cylicocyclus nassatus TaxID=53992 RepID=A0AA36HCI3_CYLNA|nr:unnamed protein product [Cylicocyclus nassatus]